MKPVNVTQFGLGIKVVRYANGEEDYQTRTKNEGVSSEIVIMQLKAYLKLLEEDYFEDFNQKAAKFRKE